MLSHLDVEKMLREERMQIWYTFLPDAARADEQSDDERDRPFKRVRPDAKVDVDNPELEATKFFLENTHAAHLHLTTGPVFQTHHTRKVEGRKRFRHSPDCFDARDGKPIVFEPFEVLTILTNERMRLDGKTAAIVTPRVTNTDAGLIVTTAYIDPYYEGIMRVVVSNMTQKRQTLHVLEPLAQCFFFRLVTGAALEFRDRFAEKTKFFQHTWHRVLAGDGEPFPRQKRPDPEVDLSADSPPAIVPPFTVDELALQLQSLRLEIAALNTRCPMVGTVVIRIAAGKSEGRKSLNEVAPTDIGGLWLSLDCAASFRPNEVELMCEISDSAGERQTEIVVQLRRGSATVDVNIPIQWMWTRTVSKRRHTDSF